MPKLPKPSRHVGPEDIRPGDYLTVTHATYEFIPFGCTPDYDPDAEVKTKRVTFIPDEAGQPLKVVAVCPPFVLVKSMDKQRGSLDLRRHHVAKLSDIYGRKVFKKSKKRKKK